MKIFVATSNPLYINKIKRSLINHYELSFMKDTQEIIEILNHAFDKRVQSICTIMLVDYTICQQIDFKKYLNQDKVVYFTLVLLYDNSQDIDINEILDTKTNLLLPIQKITKAEMLINLQLLAYNFQKFQEMQYYAFFDPLTKINNRRTFISHLEELFYTYKQENIPFCLGFIDLDHFKFINDTFGHIKGDELLATLAKIMQKKCRKTDIIFRIGGEEFAIIFPNTKLHQAYEVLERMRLYVEQSKEIDEVLRVTLSAGLVATRIEHHHYKELIKSADFLLYQAKDLGRNQICK